MRRRLRILVVSLVFSAAMLGLALGGALAQDYPKKPIRFIVPFAAGGGNDTAARIIADKLKDILGQPVLVENRPGASGRIGTDLVAKAAPDGYTIIMVSNTHCIAPAMFKKMPYDAVKDFEAITLASSTPNLLTVPLSSPAKSVADLIKLAKSNPGKLNFGVSGIGEMPHLNGELFKSMAKVDIMAVPFKGTAEAVAAVLGGHVDMGFGSIAAFIAHVQSGSVRALAITSAKRSPLAPDVPTMVESGLPGLVTASWSAILAPAGTPKAIITKLNTEIVKILNMQDVRDRMMKTGLDPEPMTQEEISNYIKTELVRWSKVIKDAGIQPE